MSKVNNGFTSLLVIAIVESACTMSVVDKGILPLIRNSVGLRFFIDVENENRLNSCEVQSVHQKCCLSEAENDDCSVMAVYGTPSEVVKARDRKTLLYVSPSLHQHGLRGHCDFGLNYQCGTKSDSYNIVVPFDTTLNRHTKKLLHNYLRGKRTSVCETTDQDSINDCLPVNCDLKYLGHKLYFDDTNKCVKVATCVGDLYKELPDVVYIPDVNLCRNLDLPVTIEEIYAITSGLGIITQATIGNEDYFEVSSNCSTISQNINLLRDIMYGKLCPCTRGKMADFSGCCKSAVVTIILCIISITAVLFSFVFCVNTSVWLYQKWSDGDIEEFFKRIKSRFKRQQKSRERTQTDREIRNALLKDVIIKDVPIELRDSIVNICDRMGEEVGKGRRYRDAEVGSQISLKEDEDIVSATSASESDE